MFDLEKQGFNRNLQLYFYCPILQNNLDFLVVSKKMGRKAQGKKWGGERTDEL